MDEWMYLYHPGTFVDVDAVDASQLTRHHHGHSARSESGEGKA